MAKFDPVRGTLAREDAIERVARGCNPDWWVYMLNVGVEVFRSKPFAFTDDMERIRQNRQGPSTPENRAYGPLMRELKKMGVCEPTDQWAPSSQIINHRRFMRIWYSLIYAGPRISRPRRHTVMDPRQYDIWQDGEQHAE
jgi:hypothetical protein